MSHFDRIIDRHGTDCVKWDTYGPDVLPMWVADMDFAAPPKVLDAIRAISEHGVLGYGSQAGNLALLTAWQDRLSERYGWQVAVEELIPLPGVVVGTNLVCRAIGEPGLEALVPEPVYGPLRSAPSYGKMKMVPVTLSPDSTGNYHLASDAIRVAITERSRVLILCNPHNPLGRVFTRAELEGVAELALRHDLLILSDEIHCDFMLGESRHIPIATLGEEVARRTITLMAPSKTYNIAGLHSSVAIVHNPELLARLKREMAGIVQGLDIVARAATVAAFRHSQPWLDELLGYLQANRDLLSQAVRERLSGVRMAPCEGTYLAWLDFSAGRLTEPASVYLRRQARVALNAGTDFGPGLEAYARLNFGCPRSLLEQAIECMAAVWPPRSEYQCNTEG
ncbi:MAG: putative C-S lyase [Chloroflexi bacterium]|nr:putative C-S lyase [Chloroflexota bacterium]